MSNDKELFPLSRPFVVIVIIIILTFSAFQHLLFFAYDTRGWLDHDAFYLSSPFQFHQDLMNCRSLTCLLKCSVPYYSHSQYPPLVNYTNAFFMAISGGDPFSFRTMNLFFLLSIILGGYFLTKAFSDRRFGLIGAFLISVIPVLDSFSKKTYLQFHAICILIWVPVIASGMDSGRLRIGPRSGLIFGAVAGLSLILHPISLAILTVVIPYFLLILSRSGVSLKTKWAAALTAFLAATVIAAPWYAENISFYMTKKMGGVPLDTKVGFHTAGLFQTFLDLFHYSERRVRPFIKNIAIVYLAFAAANTIRWHWKPCPQTLIRGAVAFSAAAISLLVLLLTRNYTILIALSAAFVILAVLEMDFFIRGVTERRIVDHGLIAIVSLAALFFGAQQKMSVTTNPTPNLEWDRTCNAERANPDGLPCEDSVPPEGRLLYYDNIIVGVKDADWIIRAVKNDRPEGSFQIDLCLSLTGRDQSGLLDFPADGDLCSPVPNRDEWPEWEEFLRKELKFTAHRQGLEMRVGADTHYRLFIHYITQAYSVDESVKISAGILSRLRLSGGESLIGHRFSDTSASVGHPYYPWYRCFFILQRMDVSPSDHSRWSPDNEGDSDR